MITSGTPRPASFVKTSKNVGLFITTPSGCKPGPLAVTLLASPACPSTLTIYGLFGISRPAKSTLTLCGPSVFGVYDTEYVRFLSLLNLMSTLGTRSRQRKREREHQNQSAHKTRNNVGSIYAIPSRLSVARAIKITRDRYGKKKKSWHANSHYITHVSTSCSNNCSDCDRRLSTSASWPTIGCVIIADTHMRARA